MLASTPVMVCGSVLARLPTKTYPRPAHCPRSVHVGLSAAALALGSDAETISSAANHAAHGAAAVAAKGMRACLFVFLHLVYLCERACVHVSMFAAACVHVCYCVHDC